jgi:hypothetical protein
MSTNAHIEGQMGVFQNPARDQAERFNLWGTVVQPVKLGYVGHLPAGIPPSGDHEKIRLRAVFEHVMDFTLKVYGCPL